MNLGVPDGQIVLAAEQTLYMVFVSLAIGTAIAMVLAVLLVLTRWVKPTKKLHPILFILFSAVVGAVFSFGGA